MTPKVPLKKLDNMRTLEHFLIVQAINIKKVI